MLIVQSLLLFNLVLDRSAVARLLDQVGSFTMYCASSSLLGCFEYRWHVYSLAQHPIAHAVDILMLMLPCSRHADLTIADLSSKVPQNDGSVRDNDLKVVAL